MNAEPIFLTLTEIIAIHDYQIQNFGGTPDLCDLGLLKSALGMPSATFDGKFLHPTVEEMAAAYLFHIVENHPFIDGNKRVGAMAALMFLDLNGIDFNASNKELAALVLGVASGKIPKSDVVHFFKEHCLE
jgi:death-on-curing protein